VYGTEGMLMLRVADAGEKNTVKGDPNSGELRLFGARPDVANLTANPTAPELLQRQMSEITPRDHHTTVSGIERGRATFAVAQMWRAFGCAIRSGSDFAPGFREQLKMHYVWDATERSVAERRWVKVDYGALPQAKAG
jgi:predicted dehydrogenase